MSDQMCSGRHHVMAQRQDRYDPISHLLNQFRQVIATTPLGTHSPRINTQTVTNRMREIGVRPLYIFYMRRFFFDLVYI